jgi:hypothetical protein
MTLHRVLSELKTLEKRINGGIANLNVVGIKKGDKFMSVTSEDEFTANAKADVESVEALIKRRHELKRALILANATNNVTIGDLTMTIAEAIDYKGVVEYKENEYNRLNRLYREALSKYETENRKNEENLEKFILNMTGKESSKLDSQELEAMTKMYNKTNEVKLIDPINIKTKIDALRKEIDDFTSEIDAVLSEANATVCVEV